MDSFKAAITGIDIPKRIALVHEWFLPQTIGGSEQVVTAIDNVITNMGCSADLAVLVDGQSKSERSVFCGRSIQTSFIQKLPFGVTNVQSYLPILPFAIEQMDLSDYPLVISSSHLVAKGVLTSPDQLHVSYVHTPARYAWDQMNLYLSRSKLAKLGLEPFIRWQLHQFRQWDQLSSARVDCLLANSRFTARRILRYWSREAEVIHPPVSVERFRCDQPREDFYLCLSRLVPNKRVDLVVSAFNRLELPLLVVGDGPEMNLLKALAGPTVSLLGVQTKEQVEDLMETCRAFVYAGIEDFGIAPVEAMAAGSPVIALARGGLLDSVRCALKGSVNPTGVLFQEQTVSSLVEAILWFEENRKRINFSPQSIGEWADRFRPEVFNSRFHEAITKAWEKHKKSCDIASSDPEALF